MAENQGNPIRFISSTIKIPTNALYTENNQSPVPLQGSKPSLMVENRACPVRFTSSSIKIPEFFLGPKTPFFTNTEKPNEFLHKLNNSLTKPPKFKHLMRPPCFSPQNPIEILHSLINSFTNPLKFYLLRPSPLLCSATLSSSFEGQSPGVLVHQKGSRHGREDQERVLISEVLVQNKDGEELENKELAGVAVSALKSCRPNSALTVQEVQEDVHRIIDSGYFQSCMPVAVDTRDGIRLIFQVEPNQEFKGLICEEANVLPTKFLEDAFRDGYGKVVNIRHLDGVINSINGWYMERGLFGMVSEIEILSGGILKLQVSEAEVNNITIRFLDRKTGEPNTGKTRPETILQQLTTKKGQVYSLQQVKRDVETVLAMGIMEDVSIIPQPAGDTGKVDLTMNVVERVSGGFSAGGGISSGITNGPPSGLIGSFSYSHRNVFGRNQKLNISLEKGQSGSIFRINYTDPWIQGDDKRTSRSIWVQNSRTPGMLVHGDHSRHGGVTIARETAGIEYGRPFRPKWNGTAGVIFQHAGARDDEGKPIIKDAYGSPLTFSGNKHDDMLIAKLESVYTGSSDHGSSMFMFSMEQGLPVLPEWLCFNRVNARVRKGFEVGPARLIMSLSGGHVMGNFSPHEAFAIGGTNSVRGYEEGAVGSGRSYAVGSSEVSVRDPAGARGKLGSGYGYGVGIRIDSPLGSLRLEYAFNDRHAKRFHFGVGLRN
ncbi:hypothetical protein AMTR_s00022p00244130 [Amborella trichopoda]|uniref:POTRA domain-containing protein n=1 Tax=Amborella trichopoda TaxID=13333 RepID=W1PVB6_AMBTC|nr:hypothetical protein AMTR_s00022p00244130 [Amborella trichopoda]